MNPKDNQIYQLRNKTFGLVNLMIEKLAEVREASRPIDSQSIYALSKLIDSYIKVVEAESIYTAPQSNQENEEREYRDIINFEKEVAPRAGFEPATKRLTAACSTTELPRND